MASGSECYVTNFFPISNENVIQTACTSPTTDTITQKEDDNFLVSAAKFLDQLTQNLNQHYLMLQSLIHQMSVQQKQIDAQGSLTSTNDQQSQRRRFQSLPSSVKRSNSKTERYNRTRDILKQSGLLDIAKQTSDLMKQSAVLERKISTFKNLVDQHFGSIVCHKNGTQNMFMGSKQFLLSNANTALGNQPNRTLNGILN